MDYQNAINNIFNDLKEIDDPGEVATYIPELAGVQPSKFGVHLTTLDDQYYSIGDSDQKFSILKYCQGSIAYACVQNGK